MVVLAEDIIIQNKLAEHGVHVQTVPEVTPIHVYPARVLSQIYSLLGRYFFGKRTSSEVGCLVQVL